MLLHRNLKNHLITLFIENYCDFVQMSNGPALDDSHDLDDINELQLELDEKNKQLEKVCLVFKFSMFM